MSSNRPPQLRLSLHGENGTSFKRSFEQYGFDLDTPFSSVGRSGGGEASGSSSSGIGSGSGNERNKRARSQNSFSNSEETAGSSTSSVVEGLEAAESSGMNIEDDSLSGFSAIRHHSLTNNVSNPPSALPSFPGLSRLPSPGPQDIEMSALDESQSMSTAPAPSISSLDPGEGYRISLERFNTFESEISALRQTPSRSPTPPLSLPTLSVIHTDDNNEVNPRLHPHARLNIPGLQVFSLGELRMPEDETNGREVPSRFQAVLDILPVDPPISLPDQSNSRNSSQPSISTLDHEDGMNSHNSLPRLSSPPLFPQEDMQWWPSPIYGNASNRSPPRVRAGASPRITPNYMPPHDWFDTPSQASQREHSRGNPLLDAHATASDRRGAAISSSRETMLRRMVAESSDGESSTAEVTSAAQAAREHHRSRVQSFRRTGQSSGFSEGGHRHHHVSDQNLPPSSFSRVDWSPIERSDGRSMTPGSGYQFAASRTRASQLHSEIEDEDEDEGEGDLTPTARRPFRLPRAEASDFDLNSSGFDRRSNPLDVQSRASPDSPISNNSADSQRPTGYRTSTSNIFLRRPISPPSNANTFGSSLRTSRLPSTANPRRAESPNNPWPIPPSYPIDESFRQPPAVQSRSYSSRVGTSNFGVSENAAELRRRLARSQILRNLPVGAATGHEEFNEDPWGHPDTLDIFGPPPRTDRSEGPWMPQSVRAHLRSETQFSQSNDSALRNRSANPSLRESEISSGWTSRGSDEHEHERIIHTFNSFSPSSDAQFGGGVMPGSYNRNTASSIIRERSDVVTLSQTATSPVSSPTTSLPGRTFVNREVPSQGRAFPSSIGSTRGISSTRPMRVQSPVAWEGNTHSIDYRTLPAGASVSRSTDLGMRALARFRQADANSFHSPSPSPPPTPPLAEPRRTIPSTAYGNLDLNAYHEGPFRASLQRFVDLDQIRSRLNRLESMANDVSPNPIPYALSHSPPTIPPHFDNDDHLSVRSFTSQQATNSTSQFASSTATDPGLRYPRMAREGGFGRTSGSLSTHNHSHVPNANPISRHIRVAAEVLAAQMETRYSSNTQEAENRTQRDRLNVYDARMQAYWNQMQSGDSIDATHDVRLTSPPSIRSTEPELQAQSARIQERNISRMNARVRAHMGAQAQTRLDAEGLSVAGVSGFRQATHTHATDRPNTLPQRQTSGRYQSDRSADSERSVANNDGDAVGSRSWSSRVRYARRDRSYRPSQPSESSGTSISAGLSTFRQNRSSSLSPVRGNSNPERSATTAAPLPDRIARFRAMRERTHRGQAMGDFSRPHLVNYTNHVGRNLGDYVRDEDFDSSYENLLSLASVVGEARPRATPSHVIAALPTGFYKDWQTVDSDQRCPICLDDYTPLDPVLKLSDCLHWLHKSCLEQWLRNANTCPVCRKRVEGSRCPPSRYLHQRGPDQDPTPGGSGSNRRYHGNDDSAPDGFVSGTPPWRFWN